MSKLMDIAVGICAIVGVIALVGLVTLGVHNALYSDKSVPVKEKSNVTTM